MKVPWTIAAIWYYEEIAQWALKNVVCRRITPIVNVFAFTSDAYWSGIVPNLMLGTVVEHHMVLSPFACEGIPGFYCLLLAYPSMGGVSDMLFPLCVSGEHR